MDFVAVLLFIELIIYISNLEFFIIELIRYFSISEIIHISPFFADSGAYVL